MRAQRPRQGEGAPGDLRPHDMEVVLVAPRLKVEDRSELKLALPDAGIPTGHLAWAVFLPQQLREVALPAATIPAR